MQDKKYKIAGLDSTGHCNSPTILTVGVWTSVIFLGQFFSFLQLNWNESSYTLRGLSLKIFTEQAVSIFVLVVLSWTLGDLVIYFYKYCKSCFSFIRTNFPTIT